jgi:probable phosphomutase (TIGR03848 family)
MAIATRTVAPAPPSGRSTKPRPSTLVLLVRHGATPTTGQVLPGRAPGLHLADAGRAQADGVAARLAAWVAAGPERHKLKIAAVYASPMERTRETAMPIASALGLATKVERGLIECDFGEWTGGELKVLAKRPEWTTVQRYPSGFRFPGGESFVGMQTRMADTIATLVARHPGEAVVAVSHADPIKAAVAAALGTHLDLFQRIVISPCSVTAISYGPGGPSVLAVNSTGSLTELRPS